MRELTLEQLKPTRQQLSKINKFLLSQREQKAQKRRGDNFDGLEIGMEICLQNWDRLVREGKIINLGPREWAMEWDN